MLKTALPAAIAAALLVTGCAGASTPMPTPSAAAPASAKSGQSPVAGVTPSGGATPSPGSVVTIQQTGFVCRALSESEYRRIRYQARGVISAAAVDIGQPGGLTLVAVDWGPGTGERYSRPKPEGMEMTLFHDTAQRESFSFVPLDWDGGGYGMRVAGVAEALAKVKACASSPSAPTKR